MKQSLGLAMLYIVSEFGSALLWHVPACDSFSFSQSRTVCQPALPCLVQDFFQLLRPGLQMLRPAKKKELALIGGFVPYNQAAFEADFNVSPKQVCSTISHPYLCVLTWYFSTAIIHRPCPCILLPQLMSCLSQQIYRQACKVSTGTLVLHPHVLA